MFTIHNKLTFSRLHDPLYRISIGLLTNRLVWTQVYPSSLDNLDTGPISFMFVQGKCGSFYVDWNWVSAVRTSANTGAMT